jgi:hypothetical protein
MKYAVEMGYGAMIYFLSFMKIGRGIQAILWFCPRNLKCCNVGITMEGIFFLFLIIGGVGVSP